MSYKFTINRGQGFHLIRDLARELSKDTENLKLTFTSKTILVGVIKNE